MFMICHRGGLGLGSEGEGLLLLGGLRGVEVGTDYA